MISLGLLTRGFKLINSSKNDVFSLVSLILKYLQNCLALDSLYSPSKSCNKSNNISFGTPANGSDVSSFKI